MFEAWSWGELDLIIEKGETRLDSRRTKVKGMEGDEKIWEEKGNARLIVTRWLVHTELEGNIGQLGFACDLPFGFLETSKSEIFTNVSFF